MISLTYAVSGLLLVIVGVLFERDLLTAATQTIGWMIVFFVASPAASAAYLTVSETFPLEIRALTIAVFYAIGTGLGGVAGPTSSASSSKAGHARASSAATCSQPFSCSPPRSSPPVTRSAPSASRSNRSLRRYRSRVYALTPAACDAAADPDAELEAKIVAHLSETAPTAVVGGDHGAYRFATSWPQPLG